MTNDSMIRRRSTRSYRRSSFVLSSSSCGRSVDHRLCWSPWWPMLMSGFVFEKIVLREALLAVVSPCVPRRTCLLLDSDRLYTIDVVVCFSIERVFRCTMFTQTSDGLSFRHPHVSVSTLFACCRVHCV